MTTNQDLLDAEMGTPPPSTVDIDLIITRQRRRVLLRRAGLLGSAGATTLALAVLLSTLPRFAGAPDVIRAGDTPTPPSTSTPPPTLSRPEEKARLTLALKRLLGDALPGAQFRPMGSADVPSEPLVFGDEVTYFIAGARITDSVGTGAIIVEVGRMDDQFRQDRACFTDPAPLDMNIECDVEPGPDGSITLRMTGASKYTQYRYVQAEIIRADGNAVHILVTNQSADQSETYRSGLQLTLSQTVALVQATDLATTLS